MFLEYVLFFAKTLTIVVSIIVVIVAIVAIASKGKSNKDKLTVKKLNEHYQELASDLNEVVLDKSQLKKWRKETKKAAKMPQQVTPHKRVFVLEFQGDMRASAVTSLREEITALLTVITPADEVVVRIESAGGMVHAYGLAASQLQRLRARQIPLTVAIDKVAASGGYLMACVANKIIAAPFAIVGSIGVIAQLPNFHRLLKKNDIDYEQFTAGEFKRTVTMLGENTAKAKEKFQEEIQDVHALFKEYVNQHRPQVDISRAATGEHWFGTRALALNLVDELLTSDDYLLNASATADIYTVSVSGKKTLLARLGLQVRTTLDRLLPIA